MVGEAYEHLIIARHYAPLTPIRTAERLVLQTLIALYDMDPDPSLEPAPDDDEGSSLPF